MILIDDMRMWAKVGRTAGHWSHLTADVDPAELHHFAHRLGLARAWYQERCKTRCVPIGGTCPHWHYDVLDRLRLEALRLGAVPISYRQMGELCRARRHGTPWETPTPLPVCRGCGCTETRACSGGCWWVTDPHGPDPRCSACQPASLLD